MKNQIGLAFCALGISAVGCVAPDDGSFDDESDQAPSEEFTVQKQAFTETSCGLTTADVALGSHGSSISPNGSYDHATCTHAYIGTLTSSSSYSAYASYSGPVADGTTWPCNAMWTQVSVWKKVGSSYVFHANGPISYGVGFLGGCLTPRSKVALPASTEFKVIGQAGFIFNYVPVTISDARNI